jgi:hypothetical protein
MDTRYKLIEEKNCQHRSEMWAKTTKGCPTSRLYAGGSKKTRIQHSKRITGLLKKCLKHWKFRGIEE